MVKLLIFYSFAQTEQFVNPNKYLKACFHSKYIPVCELRLTDTRPLVSAQLHEVRTRTRERLVVVDQAEVRAGLFAIFNCTWVGSYRAAKKDKITHHMSMQST